MAMVKVIFEVGLGSLVVGPDIMPTTKAESESPSLLAQKMSTTDGIESKRHGQRNDIQLNINTLSAKDGDLRLSATNACLPKTEISVFVTECVFFTSTCYKLHYVHIA